MKIKIISGKLNHGIDVGEVCEVGCQIDGIYYLNNGLYGIPIKVNKSDAEVVEEMEKSCETCGNKTCRQSRGVVGCLDGDLKYWQPREPKYSWENVAPKTEESKTCNNCLFNVDRPIGKCGACNAHNNFKYWTKQADIVTNEQGGKQSKSKYLWTDFSARALLRVAEISCRGKEKYGPENWKKISAREHVDHAVSHLFLWLDGDKSECHLSHAAWRVLAAMGVEEV